MSQLRLTFLGSTRVEVDGEPIARFRSAKSFGLLAFLTLESAQKHRRERLMELFWPDTTPQRASQNLRATLHRLRKPLGAAEDVLQIGTDTISLAPDADVWCDVFTFHDCLAAGRLAEAVALYQGDLLAGFALPDSEPFEIWLRGQREQLHRSAMTVLEQLAAQALEQRAWAQATTYLHRQLALEPWRERAHYNLMWILAEQGQRAAALAQYENCRHWLDRELGVEPSPEIESLHARIHQNQDVGPVAPWTAQSKGAPRARHDWIDAPEVPTLYGRESEQATLRRWLIDEESRLVVLQGMGGVGKTTLASAVARSVADRFHAVVWRSLVNAPALSDLLRSVCSHLLDPTQVLPKDEHRLLELLFAHLRQRRSLLVLDNLESILDPERPGQFRNGYEQYAHLIRRAGETQHRGCLLLTSRERPRPVARLAADHAAVRTLTLSGLDANAGRALLTARGVRGKTTDLDDLVHSYSGNPLALKLVRHTIADLFDNGIRSFLDEEAFIFGDIDDVLAQQIERLSPHEREILTWLAVVRTPIQPPDLLALLLGGDATRTYLEALHSLRRRSLLEGDERGVLLQNVVNEYVTAALVDAVCAEVLAGQFDRLNRHALLLTHAGEHVQRSQQRLILRPVAERLLARLGRVETENHLKRLLAHWQRTPLVPGYAAGNLLNLLVTIGADLRGRDLSDLCIWQADLRDVDLRGVSLERADLRHVRFTESFGFVYAVAVSPDESVVAAATETGTVHLWESATGRALTILNGHDGIVRTLSFRPDGRYLASGGADGTICLWETENWRLHHRLAHQIGDVYTLAFCTDNRTLVAGGDDSSVWIWNVETDELVQKLGGHGSTVWSVACHAGCELFACGTANGDIYLWDSRTGIGLHRLTGHSHIVSSLVFSPDGAWLASSGADGTVRIWESESGCCRRVLKEHTDWVWTLAVHPDGKTLVSGSADRTVRMWDVNEGRLLRTLALHRGAVRSIAVGRTGTLLATSSVDRSVCLWDLSTGEIRHDLRGHVNAVLAVACSPDGKRLVSGGTDGASRAAAHRNLRVWDLNGGRLLCTLSGHGSWVGAVAFHPGGEIVASGDMDGVVRLWDVERGQCLQTHHTHGGEIWSLAFGPGGHILAIGSDAGHILLRDWQADRDVHVLRGHKHWVDAVAFHPDGASLATGSADGTVRLWNATTGTCTHILDGTKTLIRSVAFHPMGHLLAAAGDAGIVDLWEVETGTLRERLHLSAERLWSVAFHRDGNLLVAGGDSGLIYRWDLGQRRQLTPLDNHGHWIISVDFTPDGHHLVSGGGDGRIVLWSIASGQKVRTFRSEALYAGLRLVGATGLTAAQRAALHHLSTVGLAELPKNRCGGPG